MPEVLTVLHVQPTHGSVDISTQVQPYVYFSHPVADTAAAGSRLRLGCLGGPPCSSPNTGACSAAPSVSVVFGADAQVARLVPATSLQAATCYVVIVESQIEAAGGEVGPLPVEIRAAFQTR